jgi:hypothetical protein
MKFLTILENAVVKLDSYGFLPEEIEVIKIYLEKMANDSGLCKRAEEIYSLVFESCENVVPSELSENDGLEQGMLFAMVYLVRYECFGEVLEKNKIPSQYAKPAIWHYKNLFKRNYNCYGSYGFCGMYRDGMVQYIKPKTFRLGRLCFEMNRFNGPYEVYKNRLNGSYLPISLEGISYLPCGKQPPKNYVGEVFMPTIIKDKNILKGYSFHSDGTLDFNEIEINLNEYKKVLSIGDNVLSVHIPGEGKLTPESVEESFLMAREFFKKYYPDINFKAFVCSSWLLDTGLSKLMRPGSNVLRFQDKFRIVLSSVNTFALYWNIFEIEEFIPITSLIPKNRFQLEVLNLLNSGEHLYSGNGFILM